MSALDVLLREFRGDRLDRYQFEDEQWVNLDDYDRNAQFKFSAMKPDPNDPSKKIKDTCRGFSGPAYSVEFGGNDFEPYGVSIAFFRCGSVVDNPQGFGTQVFMGVLKAIKQYADARKPVAFKWSPVPRSSGP